MIRHIVMWNWKEELSEQERIENGLRVKNELEALSQTIPGVVSLEFVTATEDSSNRHVVLNSLFSDGEALANYQVHPDHVKAGQFIKTVLTDRICADYQE